MTSLNAHVHTFFAFVFQDGLYSRIIFNIVSVVAEGILDIPVYRKVFFAKTGKKIIIAN